MRYNPYKSLTSIGFTKQTPKRKYFKTQFLKKTPNKTRTPSYKKLPKITNKEFLYGDFDGDKVINKYDCKPFDKKKQGNKETELKNFNLASKEVIETQRIIYNLSENWKKLPEGHPERRNIEIEIRNLKEKAKGLLQTAINLKTNLDSNKSTEKTPRFNSILEEFQRMPKENKWINKYNNYITLLIKQGYDRKYAQEKAKILVENELIQTHKLDTIEVKTKNWSGRTLQGLKLKPLG